MQKQLLILIMLLASIQTGYSQEGFKNIIQLSPVTVSTKTGEKPQAKVWEYAGKHWAVLPNSSGTYLWRLDGVTWTNVLRLSTRTTSKADCKMVDNAAHILLFQGASSQLVSVEYSPALGTYQLWSKRTSTVGLNFKTSTETATIDMDGNGRMWIAFDGTSDINVSWSDFPYRDWSPPVLLTNNVSTDDICAVIAMQGKIGVLWSNLNIKRFGFKTHSDNADPTVWSIDEVPASQSALNVGGGMADDHINLALASDGTLYAAVKTEYNTSSLPQIALLVRRPDGSWDNLYEVSRKGTRPIVILNEVLNKIRVVYTEGDLGGNILYNESSATNILFGPSMILIPGNLNNSTSTKDNFTSEIVVLASSDTQAYGVLAFDESTPSVLYPPMLSSPFNGQTGITSAVTLNWQASQGAESYAVQVSETSNFTALVCDQPQLTQTSATVSSLAEATTYYWRVKASNSNGESEWSETWSFTTTLSSSDLVALFKMEVGSGSTLIDNSGYLNNAAVKGTPVWINGMEGQAIRFSGSGQYATVPHNASLDMTYAVTIAAWMKPERMATQYVVKKATNGSTDGYELSMSSTGQIFFRINQKSSGNTYRLDSKVKYPVDGNTWMHAAATYDGAYIRLYIDGTENAVMPLSSPVPINNNSLPLSIAAESNGVYPYKGALDEVYLYNRALSADEISLLAQISEIYAINSEFITSQEKKGMVGDPFHQENYNDEFKVYPNPCPGNARVQFSSSTDTKYVLSLYDIRGNKISNLTEGLAQKGETVDYHMDITWLSEGLYFLRLTTSEGKSKTLKVISNKNY